MNDTARLDYRSSHTEQSRTLSNTKQLTLTDKIRFINKDKNLSKGTKNLGIEIVIATNWRGYCWHSIEAFCKLTASSESQVHSYLRDLQENGYVNVVSRPGKTNRYYLGKKFLSNSSDIRDLGVLDSAPKIKTKNKENVIEKPNVILNFPQEETNSVAHSDYDNKTPFVETKSSPTLAVDNKIIITPVETKPNISTGDRDIVPEAEPTQKHSTVIDMRLVSEILAVTGDKKSLGCFIKIVKDVPRNLIYAAISSLRIAIGEGIVSKPGAYFVQTIKNYCPDLFTSQKPCDVSLSTPNRCDNIRSNISEMRSDPQPIINWEDNLAQIRALKSNLKAKTGYVYQ